MLTLPLKGKEKNKSNSTYAGAKIMNSTDIKNSPLWTIWGELWNIAKAYYPYPETEEQWISMVNSCSELSKKYENTEYANLVTHTLMEILTLYEGYANEKGIK